MVFFNEGCHHPILISELFSPGPAIRSPFHYPSVFVFSFFLSLPPFSWDDSSSVSSGLSDTLDNISTDDPNSSSYAASPRKSKEPQVNLF